MRSFRDSATPAGRRRPAFATALGGLFPEIASRGGVRLVEGWLRATPRGRRRPPLLSGVARERPGGQAPRCPVSLEGVLAARGWEQPDLLARAAAGRRALAAARVGGNWWRGGDADSLPANGGLAIVAPGDAEPAARPDARRASTMLERALAETAAGRVVLLSSAAGRIGVPPGVTVLSASPDPWLLLARAARVYSAGGELGFLALAADIPVTAFAPAFYTGWGATDDMPDLPQHEFRRNADEIFAGAALVAARYRDPFHDAPASFEDTLALLADWRRLDEANREIAVCVGISWWKRRRIRDFVCSSAGAPPFRRTAGGALKAARRASGAIAGWASRLPDGLAEAAAREGLKLIRVEDGFIRSVGLGADFLPPASLVCDRRGMYFDPRQRSDLEELLATTEFGVNLLARALRLSERLVARGITKYNLPGRAPALDLPAGTRILVPGQVEDDLSLAYGGGAVRTNLGLLAAVRAANPDAVILYKPHPDVAAGHRNGAVPEASARRFADLVVGNASTAALLGLVDEVHTMTSLAGFEALLRGRRVVVYGRPFYAGWGLTDDRPPFDRGRHLTLNELVAGALILYPRYLDPLTRLPCGPEIVIERLEHPELWPAGPVVLARRLQGILARRLSEARAMLPIAGSVPVRGLSGRPRR